jgi:hypothetical protein
MTGRFLPLISGGEEGTGSCRPCHIFILTFKFIVACPCSRMSEPDSPLTQDREGDFPIFHHCSVCLVWARSPARRLAAGDLGGRLARLLVESAPWDRRLVMAQRKTLTRDSLRATRASPGLSQALRFVGNPTRIGI